MPELEKVLEDLKDAIIVVEGKRDVQALNKLGLRDIVPINGKPLIDIVQGIEKTRRNQQVVILTDFDRQGRKLNAKLMTLLQSYKVPINTRLRRMMSGFGKTSIEDLTGLEGNRIAEKVYKKEGDSHGKTRANINKVHHQGGHKGKRRYRKTGRNWGSVRAD